MFPKKIVENMYYGGILPVVTVRKKIVRLIIKKLTALSYNVKAYRTLAIANVGEAPKPISPVI